MNRLARGCRIILCLSVIALTIPAPAEIAAAAASHTCCHSQTNETQHGGCHHFPAKSPQENGCCAACSVNLAMIASSGAPLLFSPAAGENPPDLLIQNSSRSERPPVPPPRA